MTILLKPAILQLQWVTTNSQNTEKRTTQSNGHLSRLHTIIYGKNLLLYIFYSPGYKKLNIYSVFSSLVLHGLWYHIGMIGTVTHPHWITH